MAFFNFNLFKRSHHEPPEEVVLAACNVYGLSPERVPSMQAEQLHALSDNIWVIKFDDQSSAVVAYSPDTEEQPVAAPWFPE